MLEKSGVPVTRTDRTRGHPLALAAVAIELGVMFVGAIMPTPLYPLYRIEFGFSGITLTLIYAVYVLGNLAALLFFGRLADQIGRRRATLPAIGVGMASAIAFALAASTPWLFVARALSGFSTGLAAGRCLAACWRNSRLGRFGCLFTSTCSCLASRPVLFASCLKPCPLRNL
jgi:MFS family permease